MVLLFVLVALIAAGCSAQTPVVSTDDGAISLYSGTLRADYEDALDVTSQLALGTLRLEGTADAVTEAQAVAQLPLWQALQGTVLQSQRERLAVAKQVEATLDAAQVAAIGAMQLTQADAQAWLEEQGGGMAAGSFPRAGGGQSPGGGLGANMTEEERAATRERFQSMSDEERTNFGVQFAPQNGTATGAAATSRTLMRAVTVLLAERSGQPLTAVARQARTNVVATVETPVPTEASTPTSTPEPQAAPTSVPTATPEPTPSPEPAEAVAAAAEPAGVVQPVAQPQPATPAQPALEWLPDTDPGPPLTVEVTTNYATSNPLLEGGVIYKVGGFIRNPTDDAYTITAVHVTFFDADGFRGAFYPFPRMGSGRPGGEYIWHGAMEAEVTCTLLGPGEACPFTAEIAAQNMASFQVHPDAVVTQWHEPVSVTVRDTKIADTGTGYLLISGTATNANVFPVKNVVISGLLLDGSGQITSMGMGVVPGIAAGGSANFTVYVEKQPYVSYQLTVLAEQDAK